MLETMRRHERRAVALDRLLTWPERALRVLVVVLGFAVAALLWSQRYSFAYPWLVAAAVAWLLVWCAGFAAFVVFQRNRVRRRARAARQARRTADGGRSGPEPAHGASA